MKIKPLAKFPITTTSQAEEAELCISQSITDTQIYHIDNRHHFRLELNAVNLKSLSLVYNYFGTRTELITGLELDHAIFVTGIGVPIKLHIDNEPHLVTRSKAAVIAPARRVRIERPAHSEILYLRVSLSDLWKHFEKLTNRHHKGSLIFNRAVSVLEGPGAMLKGLMDHLVSIFAHNDSVMKSPAVRKGFDDLLLTSMLSLPHNKIDKLYEDRSIPVAPAVIYRAEEYMRAHLKKSINIIDLIRVYVVELWGCVVFCAYY